MSFPRKSGPGISGTLMRQGFIGPAFGFHYSRSGCGETEIRSAHLTIFWHCGFWYFSSRRGSEAPLWQ